jgi:hypothetical protein
LIFADSPILPINITDFALTIENNYLTPLKDAMTFAKTNQTVAEAYRQLENLLTTTRARQLKCYGN